ncbi:MAG TPA: efflux RND transporter periplasmic adaptor subunit [Planctomycetota bacterium]|nr:efflux RND transporter periplasmic adaptor subunit [Planctomycetota bacterium]
MAEARSPSQAELELLRIPRGKASKAAPRRKRRWLGPTVLLALLGAGAWWFRDRIRAVAEEAQAIPVRVGYAELSRPGADRELTNATGYVVARTKAALSSKIAGRIVELRVDAGSRVRKGDLIAKLDDEIYRAALKDAEAGLAAARAEEIAAEVRVRIVERDIAKAKLDLEEARAMLAQHDVEVAEAARNVALQESLLERGAGTTDAVAQAKYRAEAARTARGRIESAVRAAEGAVAQKEAEKLGATARVPVAREQSRRAEAAVDTATANLKDTELRAQFDGVVLRKEADVGEMVVPGLMGGGNTRGAVATIADFSSLELEVDVFERDLRHVREGAPAVIVLSAYPESPYGAFVRQVQPTADRQKSTVLVKVAFERLDDRVLPEMAGRATFLKPGADSAPRAEVLVPESAVTRYEGREGVFLWGDGRVKFVQATFGETRRDRRAVLSGLRGGETVVLTPPAGLRDGTAAKKESGDG